MNIKPTGTSRSRDMAGTFLNMFTAIVGRRLMGVVVIAFGLSMITVASPDDGKSGSEQQSLINARQIVIACKLYAMDHKGDYPPSLDALVPTYLTDRKILVSPLMPERAMGYDYTTGLQDTSPSTLILIEDKFAPKLKNVRIVVYTDDHGEILKLP